MNPITEKYKKLCEAISDINEHLPTLRKYALDCQHVTECGVRGIVSSYAFADALQTKNNTRLIQVDLASDPNITAFQRLCKEAGISTVFYEQSDLVCPTEQTELLFIDTWHVYGHLKRELQRWHQHVTKYIILHDTTVDEIHGETIRCGLNAQQQSWDTGIPIDEINKGLWPAVHEFLLAHPEWTVKERFSNNNGLTVLARI
jgi:hypothetical protein